MALVRGFLGAAVTPLLAAPSLFALLSTGCATDSERSGTNAPTPESAAATAVIQGAMAEDSIPAMSVAVSLNGELLWSEASGAANLETGAAATRETKFRLGSVSKVLTAGLTVKLADEGVVDLDTDIREYLDSFPDKGAVITLRQLLGHLGGIRHYAGKDYDGSQPGGMIDLRVYPDDEAILAIFADDPLIGSPGEAYSYSTFGYTLVGLVLEAATGRRFGELLEEKILLPGDIGDIAVDDLFKLVEDRAEFYDPIESYEGLLDPATFGPVVNALPLNSAYKIPAGGLVGDAEAVAACGALNFEPGFFSQAAYRELFTVQRTSAGEPTGVGLGWRIEEDGAGRRLFHHSGSQQGGRAHLSVYPDEHLAVAVLTNLGGRPSDIKALATRIAEAFFTNR